VSTSRVEFDITYEGPAVENGTMDVRELAPALLALGELCQHANRVLNGDRAHLSVNVRADFRRGSFHVSLEAVQTLIDQARALFRGEDVRTLLELLTQIGVAGGVAAGAGKTVLRVAKWLRGRTPTRTVRIDHGGVRMETTSGDGAIEALEISADVWRLMQDQPIREAVDGVTKPLTRPGIDQIKIADAAGAVVESFTREERADFARPSALPPVVDAPISANESVRALEVVKPSFQPGLKWTFSDGAGGRINAEMHDQGFLHAVATRRITFAQGDVLKVRLMTNSRQTPHGLRTEHAVVETLEVIPVARQMPLPWPTPE
jgi:hypothetical protein